MHRLLALGLIGWMTATAAAAAEVSIGSRVGKLRFVDIRYLPRTLDDFHAARAFVLVFTNTSCPLVQRYLPVLQTLSEEYESKGVQFVALDPAAEDSIVDLATQAVQHGVTFPFVKDTDAACARALGVTRTPEAVVVDAQRQLRYRGRIDDQYRLGGTRRAANRQDLKAALDAVLAGLEVAVAETEVDGCPITFAQPTPPRRATYAEHAAPILRKHCWECHQAGGPAPFSLTDYKQASTRAAAIAEVVAEGRMPPWFASAHFGPFTNRRGLADEERSILLNWVRAGTPPGDVSLAPKPPAVPQGQWQIGKPDLVLEAPVHELPASGDIPYTYTLLPHLFAQDTWVQGVEIVSDNPRAMHHCNLAFGSFGDGLKEENFITGNVPGGEAMWLEDGLAFRIPKGSILGLQIHYVATGKPEKCQVKLGLRYPRTTVQRQLRHIQLTTRRFAIPPGAPAHRVAASRVLDRDAVGVGLFAHMHLRGKDMSFTAHTPDGKVDTLLVIPNYSFAWQLPYRWASGQKVLPKGTRLDCVAHFDNSPFNPFNPDPGATVRFGPQTHHEMMYGFFFFTAAGEELGLEIDSGTGHVKKGPALR